MFNFTNVDNLNSTSTNPVGNMNGYADIKYTEDDSKTLSDFDECLNLNSASTNPFGSMNGYADTKYTKDDIKILSDFDECLDHLQSHKNINEVRCWRDGYLAELRITQFANNFNLFEGKKIHTDATVVNPVDYCECDGVKYPKVVRGGCEQCCINFDNDIPHCNCMIFPGKSGFDHPRCMHAGEFDRLRLVPAWYDGDYCLICAKSRFLDGHVCPHEALHDDCFSHDHRYVATIGGHYSNVLARLVRNDADQVAYEEKDTKYWGERKAAIVLKRLSRKRDHWFISDETGDACMGDACEPVH
jgi:hypothetical protein